MYTGIYHTHKLAVVVFLFIYLIKFILILVNTNKLDGFSKIIKVPEMIVSFLFLATGVYLLTQTSGISTFLIIKFALVVVSIPLAIVGFKKHNKALATLSVLFIFAAYGMAEMNRGAKGKKVNDAALSQFSSEAKDYDITAHGKAIYTAQCVICHGESGDAGISGAKDLKASKIVANEVQAIIVKGKNAMPSYSKSLTEEETEAITAYVLGMRK